MKRRDLILLSTEEWLKSLSLASWAYTSKDREIFFLYPEEIERERVYLKELKERLPLSLINWSGCSQLNQDIEEDRPEEYPSLLEHLGLVEGLIIARADSAIDSMKGALLAIVLGYLFLPYHPKTHPLTSFIEAYEKKERIPTIYALGERESFKDWSYSNLLYIEDDQASLDLLKEKGVEVDHLLIMNVADREKRAKYKREERSLGDLWVQGLSLLAASFASYRSCYPLIIDTEHPNPEKIEREAQAFVDKHRLNICYRTILASPGSIPFIHQEKKELGYSTEELIRDIHIRLNDDLFFDVAEGRLFQSTPGGLSLQILSTKHFHRLKKNYQKNVTLVTTPYVEDGIIFASDEALIEAQLKPLLEERGFQVTLLEDRKAHYQELQDLLQETGVFLFTGHGGPESLHTHGHYLTAEDLPPMPPLIVYASACSTLSLRPHWYSLTGGVDWKDISIESRDTIGLSMVEKGAIAFIGGMTTEDMQFSTSIYGLFLQSLLIAGKSIGEALKDTIHFIGVYASFIKEARPQHYSLYKWGYANTIHQQLLLGDPAFVPFKKVEGASLPLKKISNSLDSYSFQVEIPSDRWRRVVKDIPKNKATLDYYRSKKVKVLSPFGENIVSWGDFFRLSPSRENLAGMAVMSSFIHLQADLPPGKAPHRLSLVKTSGTKRECLFCGREKPVIDTSAFQQFRLPFLMLSPLEFSMERGWPFSLEEREVGLRIHWLVPVLILEEETSSFVTAQSLHFDLLLAPKKRVEGRLKRNDNEGERLLTFTNPSLESEYPLSRGVCREDGHFSLQTAVEATHVKAEGQFPLYQLLKDFEPLTVKDHPLEDLPIPEPEREGENRIRGWVLDSKTATPLEGVLIRIWRGEMDPCGYPLLEGFAAEVLTDAKGRFSVDLPPMKYLLYLSYSREETLYMSKRWDLEIHKGEDRDLIIPLQQAAYIKGRVTFKGFKPPYLHYVELKRYSTEEGINLFPIRRDGWYEAIVSYQDCFTISITGEGFRTIDDNNDGKGYKLLPGEVLYREYTMHFLEEEREEEKIKDEVKAGGEESESTK